MVTDIIDQIRKRFSADLTREGYKNNRSSPDREACELAFDIL